MLFVPPALSVTSAMLGLSSFALLMFKKSLIVWGVTLYFSLIFAVSVPNSDEIKRFIKNFTFQITMSISSAKFFKNKIKRLFSKKK